MAHAEAAVNIERPVHEVFEFIAEGTNNPLWRRGILEIALVGDIEHGKGAAYRQVLHGPMGRRIAGDYEITGFEADKKIEFKVIAGPARPTGLYEFKELDGMTEVRFILDFRPSGFARLMEPMINKQMHVEVGYLADLKRYLEEN